MSVSRPVQEDPYFGGTAAGAPVPVGVVPVAARAEAYGRG